MKPAANIATGVVVFSMMLTSLSMTSADENMPKKIRSVEGITEYRLDNGMKVLLFPDVSKPTVTVNVTVFVGSRHEGYGEAGMAHLLEHMVFKGTPDHPDIPKSLNERGAGRSMNGTTWLDRTNYYETLPASDDNLEFAIRMEADRLINSYIKGEDLASEMSVVRSEFERGEDSPQRVLMQRVFSAGFDWHNYGKSTIGNRADIERVPVENLKEFYKRFYQPDNAMLVLAGNFDETKALEYTQKYFGSIPRPERTLNQTYTEEPAQDGERLVTLRRVGEVALAGTMYHVPAGAHPDFPAVDILESVLTSQPSGRLYEALVKKRIAASVFGGGFATHDPGMLLFVAQANEGVDARDLLVAMTDVLENLRDAPVNETEVDRARTRLLKQWELGAADTHSLAIELSEWAAQGDWRLYFVYRDRLETVTVDDVNRVATAYLQQNNRTAGLFIPTTTAERVAIPPTPDLAEMIGDYKGREAVASGEEFDVSPLAIEARTMRGELPGGIEVTIVPKKTRGNKVNFQLTLRYGDEASLMDRGMAVDLLPVMLLRGTKNRDRQQLRDELDQYKAQVGASGDAGTVSMSIETQRENLGPVLEIVEDMLRNPSFPEDELETIKQERLARFEEQQKDPRSLAQNEVQRQINPYPPGDPRYLRTIAESAEAVKAVTVGQIREIYESLLSGSSGQLTIVGDFDPELIIPLVGKMTTNWSSDVAYERLPVEWIDSKEGRFTQINTPDRANSNYFSVLPMKMRIDDPDQPALAIGNYILGGGSLSSRLGNRVRQKEGLSYGVASSFQVSSLDERAMIMVMAISNPDNAARVRDVIREEIDLLLKDGITQQELDEAKTGYLQAAAVQRSRDTSLLQALETQRFSGRTMEFTEEQEALVRDLTVEDVNSTLRRHIQPDRFITVIAGDFKEPLDQ